MTPEPVLTVDPAFAYASGGSLLPLLPCDSHAAWRYLSSAVSRDPLDTEAHARRVLLATTSGDETQVLTALLDVFLALGHHARDLRQQLLELARPRLLVEDADFFGQRLEGGLSVQDGLPLGTLSVLDTGLMGQSRLVEQQRAAARQETLAEQAAALIDQGDLAAARALLEEGLMQHPQDAAAAQELLAVYRHSRDSQAEQAMRERFQQRFGNPPPTWA
jgi:hypothetical protein